MIESNLTCVILNSMQSLYFKTLGSLVFFKYIKKNSIAHN